MWKIHNVLVCERWGLGNLREENLRRLKDTGPFFWNNAGSRLSLLLPLLVVLLGIVKLLVSDVVLFTKLDLDELGFRRIFCNAVLEVWNLIAKVGRHHVGDETRKQHIRADVADRRCDERPKRCCARIHHAHKKGCERKTEFSKTNGSLTQKKEINQIVTQHFHICVFFF